MTDLTAWVDVGELTVWQAACLWTGILPIEQDQMSPATQIVVTRRLAMLTGAIAAGELQVNSEANPSTIDGNHKRSIVARSSLLAYAKAQGSRPEFLFPRQRPWITVGEVAKRFGVSRTQLIEGSPLFQKAIEIAEDAALTRELAEAEAAHQALVDDQATTLSVVWENTATPTGPDLDTMARTDHGRTLESKRSEAAPVSDAELQEWYRKRVRDWPIDRPQPKRGDDERAASIAFAGRPPDPDPKRSLRDRVRALRKETPWSRPGPNGQKRGVPRGA